MQNNNNKQSLQKTKQLNQIANQLTTYITELLDEVHSYNQQYYDQTFICERITNETNEIQIDNQIRRGETIFDRFHETLLRNEFIVSIENKVEQTVNQFLTHLNELKTEIHSDREQLLQTNKEILDNLKIVEQKKINRKIKKETNNEEIRLLTQRFNMSMKNSINQFRRKTVEIEKKEMDQQVRFNQFVKLNHINSYLNFEDFKQLEEFIDLEIQESIFDSDFEKERIDGYGDFLSA